MLTLSELIPNLPPLHLKSVPLDCHQPSPGRSLTAKLVISDKDNLLLRDYDALP